MSLRRPPVGLLTALLILVTQTVAWAQKTDTVVLLNGDHYTCEIKRLERGLLTVSTDDVGTLEIKWLKIASVKSPTPFDVETESGAAFVGELGPAARPGAVDVALGSTIVTLEIGDIVFMAPVKNRFRSRLTGNISFGFSFARTNSKADYSLDGAINYRGVGYENRLIVSSAYSQQEGAATISRNNVTFASERRLKGLWTYSGVGTLQQNEELSLKLRAAGGGGFGRILSQSSVRSFSGTAGLVVTREYFEGEDGHTSLESFIQVRLDVFRLDSPKVDLSINGALLPSLTDSGRVRSEFQASMRFELFIKDFFWSVSGFDSADTKPPSTTISKHDYGMTTSLGYSF
jgi:hypothetical protein